jgi:hypothetical protein
MPFTRYFGFFALFLFSFLCFLRYAFAFFILLLKSVLALYFFPSFEKMRITGWIICGIIRSVTLVYAGTGSGGSWFPARTDEKKENQQKRNPAPAHNRNLRNSVRARVETCSIRLTIKKEGISAYKCSAVAQQFGADNIIEIDHHPD